MNKTQYSQDLSDALKMEFAFKSLHVIGQVLKNFPLDLKGDLKMELMTESYDLAQRTLRSFLTLIENNAEPIAQLFDSAFRLYPPFSRKTDSEIRDASLLALVRMTEFSIFGVIKRLSLAVGVVQLRIGR